MVVETGKEDLIDYEDPADLEQSEEQEEDEDIAVEPVPTVPPKKVRNLTPHVFHTKTHPAPYFLRSGGILPVLTHKAEVSHENVILNRILKVQGQEVAILKEYIEELEMKVKRRDVRLRGFEQDQNALLPLHHPPPVKRAPTPPVRVL